MYGVFVFMCYVVWVVRWGGKVNTMIDCREEEIEGEEWRLEFNIVSIVWCGFDIVTSGIVYVLFYFFFKVSGGFCDYIDFIDNYLERLSNAVKVYFIK